LEIGSCFLPRSAWNAILLFYTSHHHWDDRCTSPHPALIHWNYKAHKLLPPPDWNCSPPNLNLLWSLGWRVCTPAPSTCWNGVSQTFCPNWPQTVFLLISASQAARITRVNQWCLAVSY
jgi:hypothetical protein